MILKNLTFEQYRGFSRRTAIEFDPNFTVIVGENGTGKTSVLWALQVLLSQILAKVVETSTLTFRTDDIAKGRPFLRAHAEVILNSEGAIATCVAQKNVAKFVRNTSKDGRPREHAVDTPDLYKVITGFPPTLLLSGKKRGVEQFKNQKIAAVKSRRQSDLPLAVYYSSHRSLALERTLSSERARGGVGAAYVDALESRELRLGEAALLWRKEAALERSDKLPARANRAIERVLPSFLGEFRNLRTEGEEKPRLVVDKRRTTLDLSQLSDGERGLLNVLIDLTRRLVQANPHLKNPAREAHAIVLIDELDLHMHPRWQREIVPKLTGAFPNCQFIATTHSPQIISEIQPEKLLLLRRDGDNIVPKRCGQSYGLDINDVLEHIMGTAARAIPPTKAIKSVEDAIDVGNLPLARKQLIRLRAMLHGDDATVSRLEATINNLEALGNASHSKRK